MTLDGSAHLLELLEVQWPIIQAPMADIGTPALAAAVSNAGGLGSLGVGATDAEGARKMIAAFKALSARPLTSTSSAINRRSSTRGWRARGSSDCGRSSPNLPRPRRHT
jgi:NAD(P)H-dependent flavin oxidoreductase YrpB (nitropropane dioxygenase family)